MILDKDLGGQVRLFVENLDKNMKTLNIPAAWKGDELFNSPYWNYQFSGEEIAEIEATIHTLKESSNQSLEFNKLKNTLAGISEELENGSGVVLLKGFPVKNYSEEEVIEVYMALCGEMGTLVRQSNSDVSSQFINYIKAEQSNDSYKLHTDRGDTISLLCVRQAREGGENLLASAVTIYNEMVQSDPEIAEELFNDLPRIYEGENGWINYPLWHIHKGKFTTQHSSVYPLLSQFISGCPKLTEKQKKGMDLLQEIGLKVGVTLTLDPGDWLICNNHVVYHARSSWKVEKGEYNRLLLGVWYSPFNSRELPDIPAFRTIWGSVEAGKPRGGFLPNHTVPLDQAITQPLSEKEAYWLAEFLKSRFKGVESMTALTSGRGLY